MIIFIEGPDGSGKTMLAEKLSKQTGFPIIHRTQPKSEEDKMRMMDEYLTIIHKKKNCIMDRAFYSELVYGPIMRDTSVISYQQMYNLERLIAKKGGGLVIYCKAPVAKLWERCTSRGEDYITDINAFRSICTAYEDVMLGVPHLLPVTTYEYQDM